MIHRINSNDRRMIARDLNAVGRVNVSKVGAEDICVAKDKVRDGLGVVGDDEAVGEFFDGEISGG